MKVAVLSDIHSNFAALEACLHDKSVCSADALIFLGDYVTDCPYPQRTTATIRRLASEIPCCFLRGNREDYLLAYAQSGARGWHYGANRGSLLYTFENLTNDDLLFYQAMPTATTLFLPGTSPLTLAHGSLTATRDLLLPDRDISRAALNDCPTDTFLCGHSHKQFVFSYNGKQLINPGSVGLAISVTPGACFTILEFHDGLWTAQPHCISYDLQPLFEAFRESGLTSKAPIWSDCIIASLKTGKDLAPSCARLARKLADPHHPVSKSISIPEHLWRQAAIRLGVPLNSEKEQTI